MPENKICMFPVITKNPTKSSTFRTLTSRVKRKHTKITRNHAPIENIRYTAGTCMSLTLINFQLFHFQNSYLFWLFYVHKRENTEITRNHAPIENVRYTAGIWMSLTLINFQFFNVQNTNSFQFVLCT